MEDTDGFVPVLEENDLAEGKMRLVKVQGTPILLIRQQGKIYAIDNRCPHQSCALSGGKLDGLVVICPCHDWRFNLESGGYEEEPSFVLVRFEWKVEAGKIWVKLPEY